MVSSFGFGKENMDLVEKSIGETVLIRFVFYGQMAVIKGKLRKVSKFNFVFVDSIEIFVVIGDNRGIAGKKVIEKVSKSKQIEITFVGNDFSIRKISLMKTEEAEYDEKPENKEEKTGKEKLIASMVSKIENGEELNEKEKVLRELIREERDNRNVILTLKEKDTLYFNPFIVKFRFLNSNQIQKFKETLWGEEARNSARIETEEIDNKFKEFWYK